MLNSVNSEFRANDDTLEALTQIRQTPNKDIRRDYLMLNNLNYLHAIWSLRQEHALRKPMADAMLKRGFLDAFRQDMQTRIARQKKKQTQQRPPIDGTESWRRVLFHKHV